MLALVSFDLDDAEQEDYAAAYEALAKIGFYRFAANPGQPAFRLPSTTVCGPAETFDGAREANATLTLLIEATTGKSVAAMAVCIGDFHAVRSL